MKILDATTWRARRSLCARLGVARATIAGLAQYPYLYPISFEPNDF